MFLSNVDISVDTRVVSLSILPRLPIAQDRGSFERRSSCAPSATLKTWNPHHSSFSTGLTPALCFLTPCKLVLLFSLIMNENFTFWFPSFWTMIGAIFTILAFFLAYYVSFVRRDPVITALDRIRVVYEKTLVALEYTSRGLKTDLGTLKEAQASRGMSAAETSRTWQQLMINLRALATATRETGDRVERSMTDSQAPADPVLLEILTEVQKLTLRGPTIQRRLPAFSLHVMKAQAEALARERIRATPNPLHDVD